MHVKKGHELLQGLFSAGERIRGGLIPILYSLTSGLDAFIGGGEDLAKGDKSQVGNLTTPTSCIGGLA